MNIIKKIILFIKSLFRSQNDEIKKIEEPKKISNKEEPSDFINSLKVNTSSHTKKNPPVETLICPGDGIGIRKKRSS